MFVRQEMMTERDDSVTPEKLVENLRNLGKIEPDREQRSSLDASLKQNSLGEALPVLVDESDHVFFPTGEVTLQLKRGISAEQLATIAQGHNISVLRAIPYITNGFVVRAGSGEDGIELARVLVESGVATFAEPNLVAYLPHREVSYPRNSEFPKQWHLNNTGQLGTPPDVDISAIEAWDITTGSPYVCIAIIDSGVDLNHEAFAVPGKIVAPFDFEDTDNLPMPIDPHGTRCAGIAVAPLNRGKVVGVAPDCTLMPIRRATVSDHLKMADAFAWAADHGAAVISCSFGYDNKPWPQPEIVGRAVEYAATRGRNGKGCVIVWAAGNGNESISTDEWASNKNVIAVAALTDKNERAEYSDYGPEVDVCALSNGGVNGITTTTLGGYTDIFGGTSAAAPMVAGVAGLILSINPNLSSQEVRTLLCTSAD
ncbi:MAG: S8 family serine peptidase, partial [Nitrospira sp.]